MHPAERQRETNVEDRKRDGDYDLHGFDPTSGSAAEASPRSAGLAWHKAYSMLLSPTLLDLFPLQISL